MKKTLSGSWLDLTILPFILLAVGIVLLASLTIMTAVYDSFNDPNVTMDEKGRINALSALGNARNVLLYFDVLFIMIVISLNLFIIVSAYSIRTHPIMFVIAMVFQMINVLMADISSQVYANFANNAQMLVAASQYPIVTNIILSMPKITLIVGVLLAVVMLAKPAGDGSV